MHLSRLILSLAGLLLVIGMFFLPKVVVEDQQDQDAPPTTADMIEKVGKLHDRELTEIEAQTISDLKEDFKSQINTEKSATFADSLAGLFEALNFVDSAAVYFGKAAQLDPSEDRLLKAGNAHFEAYNYAVALEEQNYWGEQARSYYQQLLEENPSVAEARAKTALTYLPQQPMQTVVRLREVLEEDPENELALFNLGLLSLQSSQFDKAVQRFEKLTTVDSTNVEGQFYLGVAYYEMGNRDLARSQFLKVMTMEPNSEIQANVEEYLKELE